MDQRPASQIATGSLCVPRLLIFMIIHRLKHSSFSCINGLKAPLVAGFSLTSFRFRDGTHGEEEPHIRSSERYQRCHTGEWSWSPDHFSRVSDSSANCADTELKKTLLFKLHIPRAVPHSLTTTMSGMSLFLSQSSENKDFYTFGSRYALHDFQFNYSSFIYSFLKLLKILCKLATY